MVEHRPHQANVQPTIEHHSFSEQTCAAGQAMLGTLLVTLMAI
jgi:hypothetical protein